MPSAAPAVLLHSLHTQQGVCNIVIAMTRRDFVKPVFSLRIKRFVKTHALSLLGTTRLLSRSGRRTAVFDADANAIRWLRRNSGPCIQHLPGDSGAQPVLSSLPFSQPKSDHSS